VYIDDNSTTAQAVLPFNFYLYATANPATNELEAFDLYMIAEGLYKTNVKYNQDLVRGPAHRELWVNMTAVPVQQGYTIDEYHWEYSVPSTVNQQGTVTTGLSDTLTIGESASLGRGTSSFGFSQSYAWTNSYSQTTDIEDVSVNEDTDPISGEGEWYFYQEAPFNIEENPPYNFGNDWEAWYSSEWSPCVVQIGPNLAFNSQQSSTAIRWQASPALINFSTATFNVAYSAHIMLEVDTVWCPDGPNDPCGSSHHCLEWDTPNAMPSWTVNVIQSLNNINVTSSVV